MVCEMKTVDFDKIINRRQTNCGKWDTMDQKYDSNDLIHLGVADMDFAPPFPISQAFEKIIQSGPLGYTDLSDGFYDGIITWYEKQYGLKIEREWIVFCPRINIAAGICVNEFSRPGDQVMIHTPAYSPLKNAISKNSREVLESPLVRSGNSYAVDYEQMERAISTKTKILLLCSPHNPSTKVFEKAELEKLGEFCIKHDLLLFVDEIHGDIVKNGTFFHSIMELPSTIKERTICATSLTKTFNIPGVIVSYMLVPNESIRNKIREAIDRIGMHNPTIFSVAAVETGYTQCDEWYKEMLAYIDRNESFTREYFEHHFPHFQILERQGTYLLWIDYRLLLKDEVTVEEWFIKKAKVSVYMGSSFGDDGNGYFRLNLASPQSLLEEAYERMAAVYEELII